MLIVYNFLSYLNKKMIKTSNVEIREKHMDCSTNNQTTSTTIDNHDYYFISFFFF